MKDLIIRFSKNPILERDTIAGYDSLFNPGAIRYGDKIIQTGLCYITVQLIHMWPGQIFRILIN